MHQKMFKNINNTECISLAGGKKNEGINKIPDCYQI